VLFTFSEKQIGALLPAFLHVDAFLNISALGPGISRHLPHVRIGMPCDEAFKIVNFGTVHFFREGRGVQPVQMISRVGDLPLSGAAVFHEAGCLLAVRFALSEEIFADGSMNLSDFGHADPAILSTMLIALQRAMLEESQATAIELAYERQRSTDLLERTSRVAGYMAHDFNNLLSIIRLNTDRLLRQFGTDEKIGKLANIIQEMASRGSDITQSLMSLSLQRTDTRQPLSVDEMIKDYMGILDSLVGSNITLKADLNAGNCKCVVSYNDLLNGLINVLINAREAMPRGGEIDISTSIGNGPITRGGDADDVAPCSYVAIRIADTGIGMSEALLSRAFEPQFSSKPNGTGLGLPSVRNFAVEVGGDVWLESTPAVGTTVYLHLPIAEHVAPTAETDFGSAQKDASKIADKQRILLVEDEPYALEALVEMLEAEGYTVTPCASGEAALMALEQDAYDVLLTDIVMPGQNGTEVARHACIAQPSIRIILMSGYVPDSASFQPGWRFLHKPMESAHLLQLISA
jgi:signal transduction histidine kinase/CheY-like chemotaxis protein